MENINSVVLVGRLVRDAELMYTNSGYALCKFSMAVNTSKKVGENWEDEANFFDCTLWGKRGESLNPYLLKGQQIAIYGRLKQDRWEQDGQKRSKITIDVSSVELLGGRKNEDNQQQNNGVPDNDEEDIPF